MSNLNRNVEFDAIRIDLGYRQKPKNTISLADILLSNELFINGNIVLSLHEPMENETITKFY